VGRRPTRGTNPSFAPTILAVRLASSEAAARALRRAELLVAPIAHTLPKVATERSRGFERSIVQQTQQPRGASVIDKICENDG
jgi:hypothetical protein